MIIVTQVSGKLQGSDPSGMGTTGHNLQTNIALFNPLKPGEAPAILTGGFYSAKSPEISFDGTTMLFSALQKQDGTWQIWEMELGNLKSRQITSLPENCFEPAYLPNGRIVFSKESSKENLQAGRAITSCNPDGSDLLTVTFNPYDYSALSVLSDGRLLARSRNMNQGDEEAVYMALRPDGTKNVLFYNSSEGTYPLGRARETSTGNIVFIGSEKGKTDCGILGSMSYNNPLHSFVGLSAGTEGSFIAVFPVRSGKLLVSYRKTESDRYSLYEFDPEKMTLGQALYTSKDFDIAEVVAIEKHQRSRKLPSEVDFGVKTGLILCQDVNYRDLTGSDGKGLPGVNKIRIIGRDSTLGEVNVEKDGSFFLKVIADTPFRIQTIDDKGNVVGKECSWIYLRPNERRGCVGCHEDHEMVPENKVSLAVRQAPVNVPVHIGKVVEKKVSLE